MVLVSLISDTSPTSTVYSNIDSGVFQYIGNHILIGQMPYLDFFDHKGPTLYLINALAAALAPGGFGLYVVDTLFLISAALVTFLTCRRFATDFPATVAVIIVYATLGRSLLGGNYVEQYALLFASVTLLCFSSYFVKGRLASWESFVIGLCAGLVFFLRPNLLGAWVVFCAAIIFFMVRDKKTKDIARTVLLALAGFLCFVVPVLLWLFIGGAFPDFIDQYFIFNLQYSDAYDQIARIETFIWMITAAPVVALALMAGVFAAFRAPKIESRFWITLYFATVFTLMLASMSGREYQYYLMAWVPYVALPLAYVLEQAVSYVKKNVSLHWVRSVGLSVVIAALLAFSLIPNVIQGYGYAEWHYSAQEDKDMEGRGGVVQAILALSTPEEKILVCGAECWAYNETGRLAATKYIFQPDDTRLEIRERFLFEDIQANKPKLIVIPNNFNELGALKGLPGYTKVFQNTSFMIFSLNTQQ